MAYKQYTHCTASADFKKFNRSIVSAITGVGGFTALIASIFIMAAAPIVGIAFVLIGSASLLTTIIMTFEYLLGGKLICLGGDRLAMGTVINVELPDSKDKLFDNIDNDYCINLLLCPYELPSGLKFNSGDSDEKAKENLDKVLKSVDVNVPQNLDGSPNLADTSKLKNYQDDLVNEQDASKNRNNEFTGYESIEFLNKPNFHLELEGDRISNMYKAFLAAWALVVLAAIAAGAVSSIPVVGWLLALLIMLFGAAVAGGIAAVTYVTSKGGSLDDVDPSIGTLSPNDLIVAYGTWVYDSGHNYDMKAGWNELHPVKYLSKGYVCLGKEQADVWEKFIIEFLNMGDIRKLSGKDPLIGVVLHPLIDGCDPRTGKVEY